MTTAARPTEERASHDLSGLKFGRLTAVRRNGAGRQRQALWLCVCACGKEVTVMAQSLRRLRTQSCGCYATEKRRQQAALMRAQQNGHGYYNSPTYKSWSSMHGRCLYSGTNGYHNYGGRGIAVCERWEKFENFLADMGERPRGTTLERKNQNGDYEPSNCRWATNGEQARNRRNNHVIEFRGVTKCLSDWASDLGITPTTLTKRLTSWTLESALTRPKNLQKVTR